MTSRSEEVGKAVLHGIDVAETGAHRAVASGAALARSAARNGSEWAAKQGGSASRKARTLRRGLQVQSAHLERRTRQAVSASAEFARRNPWTTAAIVSVAAVVVGAVLRGRHHHRSGFFGGRRWIS